MSVAQAQASSDSEASALLDELSSRCDAIHFDAGSEGDNSDSGLISVGLPSNALPFSTGGLASARNALVKKRAVFRWAGIRIKSQKGPVLF